MQRFRLNTQYTPSGDQPKAIETLISQIESGQRNQVLLGVTGSGKTFTVANVIERLNRPSLIMAPNKTLAAQLYSEMKGFFPDNAVEYFVSYYDYYQPEAYIARTDTYIEKDSSINEHLDSMRHSATRALIERRDVVVVASISCIYGIGSFDLYASSAKEIAVGTKLNRESFLADLVLLHHERNDHELARGRFRARGEYVDVAPAHLEDKAWRIKFGPTHVEEIFEIDSLSNQKLNQLSSVTLYANTHHFTPKAVLNRAVATINQELEERLKELNDAGKLVEELRLRQKTRYDLEMILETGTCKGIENYSRHLTGRAPGESPPTLFEYLPKDALLFVDESHVSVPQIGGMFNGDRSRKLNLVEHGFRLPSALDNRPLKFEEWENWRPQSVFVSATPGPWEIEKSNNRIVEQIVRPTGLLDPICEVRPTANQVEDVVGEVKRVIASQQRALIVTLTKKMAERLSEYFCEIGISVGYIHSDIKTLERIEILTKLRKGEIDAVIGINLLREGLDIPECSLIAILDADREGFLRSRTSLVQTIGRAARHLDGRAILYADKITGSIEYALQETERRRVLQMSHNLEHGIVPKSISKSIDQSFASFSGDSNAGAIDLNAMNEKSLRKLRKVLVKEMREMADKLEFEEAKKRRTTVAEIDAILIDL